MKMDTNQKVFGWCFIGCGTLAQKVAKQLLPSGQHKIVSVYSRSYDKCAAFAQRVGAAACHLPEEAMQTPGVDAVYVVTPHTSHFAYARQALLLKKPVLCEKPVTVCSADAEALVRLAREQQVYFAEAMWTWFAPAANQIKAWLDAGEYGTLRRFVLNCHVDARWYAPRVTNPNQAGGALLDMGVYPLTYMVRLFGKPDRVTCTGHVSKGIDWDEEVTFHYASGFTCSTSISIKDLLGMEYLLIEGDKARSCLFQFHQGGSVKLKRRQGKTEHVRGKCDYLNEFNLVANEIREALTESRYVPMQVTLDVMAIMDECRRQMKLVYPFEMQ